MSNPKEVTVKIKGDDQTLIKKFLVYEDFIMNLEDKQFNELVESARDDYTKEIESIQITVKMEIPI